MNHHSGTSSSKNSESNNVMMNADGGQNGIEMNKARQKVKLTVGLQVIWSTHVGVHSNHSMKRNEQMNSNESASSATNIATTSSKQDKQDKQDKQEKHEKYDKHDKHEKNKKVNQNQSKIIKPLVHLSQMIQIIHIKIWVESFCMKEVVHH